MPAASNWSLENLTSPQYKAEFVDVVRVLTEWFAPHGGLQGKRILDFGCGAATSALGIALQQDASHVIGIDPNHKFWRCLPNAKEQLGLETLPRQLELF